MALASTAAKAKGWFNRVRVRGGTYQSVDGKQKFEDDGHELSERARGNEQKDGETQELSDAPSLDPSPTNAFTRWRRKLSGWRTGTCLGIILAFVVLILNIALTAWATGSYPSKQAGIVTMSDGSCSVARKWSIWLHLAINALSTLLLGASNYVMQCLSAPTRREVTKFHARGSTLDIGIQSVRNIFRVTMRRRVLWWLLALTSIPLHLLYNSAVFEAITANEYYVFIVGPDFFDGAPWSEKIVSSPTFIGMNIGFDEADINRRLNSFQQKTLNVQRLDSNASIIAEYSNAYLTNRGDVLMVAQPKPTDSNSSLLGYTGASPSMSKYGDSRSGGHTNYWLCGDAETKDTQTMTWTCDPSKLNANDWTIFGYAPEYFLSELTDEHCELLFSRNIMIVVIICNVIKLLVMGSALLGAARQPLVTFGDAVASFLENPDPHTKGLCLLSKEDVQAYRSAAVMTMMHQRRAPASGFYPPLMAAVLTQSASNPQHFYSGLRVDSDITTYPAKTFTSRRLHWLAAASPARWGCTVALCVLTLILVTILLSMGINSLRGLGLPTSASALWSLGFGTLNANTLISLSSTFFPATAGYTSAFILLANTPQIIFSFLYLLYNSIYTCMTQAAEWSSFSYERKGLRVTQPRGQQRSTYWLHLPYRYGIPLMTASMIMHWLISQSIFLARIQRRTVTTPNEVDMKHNSAVTCAYSIMPVIFSITLGCTMLIVLFVLALVRRLPGDMPLIGSNSAVISAACHGVESDENAAVRPLMWGVTNEGEGEGEGEGAGHCSFSSAAVGIPAQGRRYAGLRGRKGW